ncbi:MAG TPA: helix-turn-helix domain-containing protein [Gammaproteobacteria bacterium]|nr:helix-turn-helix domain-containing protein [Gammaproteobacteria bacterium]
MSNDALRWAWAQPLNHAAKLVLLCLADHADDSGTCWPSLSRIAAMTGLDQSTVKRKIRALEHDGLVNRSRSIGGAGHSTRYQVQTEKQAHCAPVKQARNAPDEEDNRCTLPPKQVHAAPITGAQCATNHKEPSRTPKEKSEHSIPTCPHAEVIAIYHEVLPELPRVQPARWQGSTRARDLQARWREDERHRNLRFWRWFFEAVRVSPFHLGENARGWRADLGWLMKRSNFDKVIERGTDQRRRAIA